MSTNHLRSAIAATPSLRGANHLSTLAANRRHWLEEVTEVCQRLAPLSRVSLRNFSIKLRLRRPRSGSTANKQLRRFVPRRGESGRVFYRSERLFDVGYRWYFTTREGQDIGPYWDRREAELALAFFLATKLVDNDSANIRRMALAPDAPEFEAMVAELVGFFQVRRKRSATSTFIWVLKRLQMLRSGGPANSHTRVRTAALEYVIAEGDNLQDVIGRLASQSTPQRPTTEPS